LLNRGAHIDDGIENKVQTPLHMAADAGHVKVMKKLINRGANPNAMATDVGPPVNSAILSGSREAVELLVQLGVSLTEPNEDGDTAITLAALFSDISMFEYLTEAHSDKIPADQLDRALVKAAEAGRAEVFNKLLPYHHPQECYQEALEQATEDDNWDIILILLEKCTGLDCNALFVKAATSTENQDKVLEAIWRHTDNAITPKTLNDGLFGATDLEKESTVRLLIETFKVDANATGEE
jgi:ankyrin repeat protein